MQNSEAGMGGMVATSLTWTEDGLKPAQPAYPEAVVINAECREDVLTRERTVNISITNPRDGSYSFISLLPVLADRFAGIISAKAAEARL